MTAKNRSAPRGRPRAFDIEDALERAQALFHERGYDNVGVAAISTELGIKPPSLYAAFGNKLGLYEAVLERYADSDGQFIAKAFANAESVTGGLRDMLQQAARIYCHDGSAAGCLITEGTHGNHDREARRLCAAKRDATRDFIATFVETEFPKKGAETADMVTITLAGLSASARSGMGHDRLAHFADMAADALTRLLREPTGTTTQTQR